MQVNGNLGSTPNYSGAYNCPASYLAPMKQAFGVPDEVYEGEVLDFSWLGGISDYDFYQPGRFWEVLGKQKGEQEALVHNVASHVVAADEHIRDRVYAYFSKANKVIGELIKKEVDATLNSSGKSSPRL
ncbi:unnamed protein product [Ambrosiozyma monospora]|uniref:Unnamed protein product n=1 Tax=Ambrosiozyma monospora TaxID=43982 RepID=A0ACB5U8F8_AMBMO|nr:unnamed protein product [Ambrosiozyma monospora]